MVAPVYDLAVIGGGIVGIAAAREALRRDPRLRIVVLEKERRLAAHQSGRNSGVIHSGIYYAPGSLKARLCAEGRRLMLDYCREKGVAVKVCGKVVVAVEPAELPRLEELRRRGQANGVEGLEVLSPERLRDLEPEAAGVRALRVPSAAVTDFAAVTGRLAEDVEAAGGQVRTGAEVTAWRRESGSVRLETSSGDLRASRVLNCAGLHSDRIARMGGAVPDVAIVPFRGSYRRVVPRRAHLVRALIYPVPDPVLPFLGVHLTRRIDDTVEAGPTAAPALMREAYADGGMDPSDLLEMVAFPGFWRLVARHWRAGVGEIRRGGGGGAFLRAARRLLPGLEPEDLEPGGCGVRAQAIDRTGALVDDFRVLRSGRGVHVLNAPSPAATASLAIARHIVDLVPRE